MLHFDVEDDVLVAVGADELDNAGVVAETEIEGLVGAKTVIELGGNDGLGEGGGTFLMMILSSSDFGLGGCMTIVEMGFLGLLGKKGASMQILPNYYTILLILIDISHHKNTHCKKEN